MHAYAMAFPDVGDGKKQVINMGNQKTPEKEDPHYITDANQGWYCVICPLTNDLREPMKNLVPEGELDF